MINRITKNEERLDKILLNIKDLGIELDKFNTNIKEIKELNKYYGSNDWFDDREAYDNNKIPKIKAGVLSEDAIWNLDENTRDLINRMDIIIKKINNIK